jgi:hypothetical protein
MKILRDFFAGLFFLVAFLTLMVISAIGISFVLKLTCGYYLDSQARIFIGTVGGLFIAALCVIGWQSISPTKTPD